MCELRMKFEQGKQDLICICTLSITGHDFHFVNLNDLLHLTEFNLIQHESPHIVTEAISV